MLLVCFITATLLLKLPLLALLFLWVNSFILLAHHHRLLSGGKALLTERERQLGECGRLVVNCGLERIKRRERAERMC